MSRGSIPHALLFTGIPGLGKAEAALHLAMALNCQAGRGPDAAPAPGGHPPAALPCRRCRSCRRIRSGNHPDVIPVEAAGPFIRIDQIRDLCRTLAMKPYEARWRVVIIRDAQALNAPAGNALLKVLEEPPEGTVLVLTANRAADLLPTLVSRCRQIRFTPLPRARLAALLTEREGVPADRAGILAAMADGSVARALELHRGGWVRRRAWLLDRLQDLPGLPLGALMALAARLAPDRNTAQRHLEILFAWARDVAVCRVAPDRVIAREAGAQLQRAAVRETADSALEKAEAVRLAQQDLRANANPRLTMEALVLKLAEAGRLPYDTGK